MIFDTAKLLAVYIVLQPLKPFEKADLRHVLRRTFSYVPKGMQNEKVKRTIIHR